MLFALTVLNGRPANAAPYTVATEALYVRRGPGTQFPPFATLTRGDPVEVQELRGEWARVVTGSGQSGYVPVSSLVPPGRRLPPEAEPRTAVPSATATKQRRSPTPTATGRRARPTPSVPLAAAPSVTPPGPELVPESATAGETPTSTPTAPPSATREPSHTPRPTQPPEPTRTREPSQTPEPTRTAKPSRTPKPTQTPMPSRTPKLTPTTSPSATPRSTATTRPTRSPWPTATSWPTSTATKASASDTTPAGVPTPTPTPMDAAAAVRALSRGSGDPAAIPVLLERNRTLEAQVRTLEKQVESLQNQTQAQAAVIGTAAAASPTTRTPAALSAADGDPEGKPAAAADENLRTELARLNLTLEEVQRRLDARPSLQGPLPTEVMTESGPRGWSAAVAFMIMGVFCGWAIGSRSGRSRERRRRSRIRF